MGAEKKWLFTLFFTTFLSLLFLLVYSISSFGSPKPFPSVIRHGAYYPPSFSYYISGGRGDADRMLRLLLAVYHPRNRYLLHLNIDASDDERRKLIRAVNQVPAISTFANVDVIGKPNIASILRAAAILLKLDAGWNWFVVLSATDYPLLTQDVPLFHGAAAMSRGSKDGSEEWGYVEVRPKAHMFWWLYKSPNRVRHSFNPWPTILWLQGGPGSSGVGKGNFEEIGPLDSNLKPRNSTWLQVADLLFVDNPVGAGYSFVEDNDLYVKTDEEAAADLTTLLKRLFNRNKSLQESPLYIVAESYGGKYAVTLALSALKAIEAGKLKLKLGGVAIGNSWISSEDFVLSWGPLLKDVSRLDKNGLEKSNSIAQKIKQQIRDGLYANATQTWAELERAITSNSNNVDFYNFLLDAGMDAVASTAAESSPRTAIEKYSTYLGSLEPLMNGIIRKKLKIIPDNVIWGQQSSDVFDALSGDFMKPRIKEVDELLAEGVNVTVYNGQLDVICSTKGAEAWVEKLEWEGLKNFLITKRSPLYFGEDGVVTKGFTKSYKNLQFYWILGAGHFVPVDEPWASLQMIRDITKSPAIISRH